MDHSRHTPLATTELTPVNLEGVVIYGPDDERVGTVGHLHGGVDGQVIVDVGGFLGLGAKPVAIPLRNLNFMRDEMGSIHGVTSWTKDELKDLPEHVDL